jgi:hypothetical protein
MEFDYVWRRKTRPLLMLSLSEVDSGGRPGMFALETHAAVRCFGSVEGNSRLEAARRF